MPPSTPFRSPADYFERLDRPSLAVGGVAVAAQSILVAAVIWWFMQGVLARLDAPPAARAKIESAVSGVIALTFVSVLVGWLLYAGVFHLFLWFADAERGFTTTLAVIGESELVSLLLLPASVLGFHLLLGQVPSDPQAAVDFFNRAAAFGSPVLLLVSLVGTVWKALIQSAGLAVVHDVAAEKTFLLAFAFGGAGFLLNLL